MGRQERLRRMCPRCRFEYRSPDLLGTLDGLWTELWRRIEVEDPAIEGAKGGAKLSPLPTGTGYPGTRAPTAERS
jgi:carbohydrate-binding DOMON domain-containing protein